MLKFINNDVNLIYDGKSLLHFAILNKKAILVDEIINNPDFDSKKSDIVQAFRLCYSLPTKCNFINNFFHIVGNFVPFQINQVMAKLYSFDKEHDHLINFNELLENGNSYFTDVSIQNKSVYEFFFG